MPNQRSYWGWGYEDFPFPTQTLANYTNMMKQLFQIEKFEELIPTKVEDLNLRLPRFTLPEGLSNICSSTNFDPAIVMERHLETSGEDCMDCFRIRQIMWPILVRKMILLI